MQKNIHFIGIGGIGTSALAQIFNKQGHKISGSDQNCSAITNSLKRAGVKVSIGHSAQNIKKSHDLVIYSPAIPTNNPELQAAKKLKIKCQSYPEALGDLTKNYYTIAIAGTHGKSTTTAMTALALKKLDPTVVIGTKVPQFRNRNYRVGKSKYLIIEACEYRESFTHFHPNLLIITNIEAEHLDYFKNLTNYKKTFEKLVQKVPKDGQIIINGNDKNSVEVSKKAKCKVIKWQTPISLKLRVPGKFNLENASSAYKAAIELKLKPKEIKQSLENFKGTWRRMEKKVTKLANLEFIDDYGHHPTEIKVTLKAIRETHQRAKILCVFQPHQYSRTKHLLKDFGAAFKSVNQVIIPNIYRVRDSEEDLKSVSTDDLVKEIKKSGTDAKNGEGLKNTANYIRSNQKQYNLVVTMGAGDISKIYKYL
ncbi:UDP-N-acetylmuramate--L-alanine ligase [Candidatus Peregrinibacteria bacterium]|nr:UDP-N-acetylmuramate--L-alanine ligase [Candidatus Peregrinibacteria bacterium]